MFCTNCGTESHSEDRFCKNCGTVVGPAGGAEILAASDAAPTVQAFATPPATYQQMTPQGTTGVMYQISPSYRLFDPAAVGLATFFGSPIAGTILMAVNYSRLGKAGKGVLALLLGVLGTAAIVAIGWNKPVGSGSLGVVLFIVVWQVARAVQGNDVNAHVARGGALASKWLAFGIGIATLVVVVAGIFAVAFFQQSGNTVTIGSKDQIIISGTASKADATALGNALKTAGYFQDRGVTVLLDKESSGTSISFVTKEGFWNQPGVQSSFEQITWQVAPSVGGFPVTMKIVDSNNTVEKTSNVGKANFDGGDAVIYMGSATQADAQTLGQRLKTIGYFLGKGADVFLTKHDDGTTLAYVVGSDAWTNPETAGDFETITRDVASSIGGLPVHMDLDDTTLTVKKDEVVK